MRRAIVVIATSVARRDPARTRSLRQSGPNRRGAVAAWEALLKLQTVASIMHTTAHPDDEQGELLALLSRGRGVRTALLTLTRGEAGDNALGPELFDALGLLRTDELAIARRGTTGSTSNTLLVPPIMASQNEPTRPLRSGTGVRSSATWCARFVRADRSS